ncbi:MAG: VOC family protein [Melioribacteraceae bacterium]|nr:VOC family protein [Melioribacteraceae bacterium]
MELITTGIDHINLEVSNLSETIEFYKTLFGFEIRKEQPDENSAIVGNDVVKLCIYEVENFTKYEKKGYHHFGLHIENFDEIIEKCEKMNLQIYYGGVLKWENSESIYIQDPNGYEIELSKNFGGGI